MPDVGVLNLTIKDNSQEAAAGLDKLVSALQRVKNAVNTANSISGYAENLKKFCKAINENLNGTTITKISQLADSLKKLKEAGGTVGSLGKIIKDVNGFSTAADSVTELKDNLKEIKSIGEIKIPVKTVVDDNLKTIYLNEKGFLMGNTPDVPALTEKYKAFPDRTLEDLYNGTRWSVNKETGLREQITNPNDLMSQWLHGNGSETEQAYAIQQAAEITKSSVEDVKKKIAELSGVAEQAKARLQELFNQHYHAGNLGDVQQSIDNMLGIGSAPKDAQESMQAFLEGMQGMGSAAQNIRNLNPELAEMTERAEKSSWSMQSLKESIFGLKKTTGNNLFGNLLGSLGRLIKFRMLRYVIRSITSGFKEGIENVYHYSEAINSAFAPAMDSAKSALDQMKNSLGAAIAPAIQAVLPIVNTLVNAFISAVNWVNQLFALLGGQKTWTRALPQTTKAFDDQKKAAKGAGAAIKDLLADWDELNIIQSETTGGGGSASTATDYLKMFEEVGVFDNKIKDIVNFVRDNFDTLKRAAIDIGAAILGWKVSSMFSGFIGTLGALVATAATIDFTLRLTDAFGQQFVSSGKPGWFIADALTGAVGATLAGQLAAKIAGGAWGSITSGFTLMLAGAVNLKNGRNAYAQSKIAEGQMLSILGSVEEGIGAALIAAGFTASTPVAVGIGAAVAVYSYAVNALAAVNITGVKWGENTMTPEEVQEYVKTNMLSVDIDSQVTITHAAIDLAEGEQQKLAEQATALLQPVNALKLGVNIEDSLTQIKNDVFGDGGLLAQFKSFTSAQKELVNTAETYVPTIDASGNNISGEIMKESNSAWAELNGLMDDLGTDLSKHLTRAMDKTLSEELRQFEMNAVTEITDTMIRVSLAGKKATIGSDALSDLAFDLTTASKGTFEDVLKVYEQYKDKLTEENKETKKAEASTFASSAAIYREFAEDALKKAGGDTTDEMYLAYIDKAKHFEQLYGEIMSDLAGSVEASVNEALGPGKELIKQTVATMLSGAKELRDGRVELFTEGKIKGLPTGWAGGLKENTSLAFQNLIFGGMNEGITDQNAADLERLYKEWLSAIIKDFMPDDYQWLQDMIDIGAIDYSDIIDPETLFKNMELVQGMDSSFYKEMWERLFGTDKPETPKIDNTALNESVEDAKGKVSGMVNSIRASISSLEGLGFSFDTNTNGGGNVTGRMRVTVPKIATAATGGFIKSGDLIMANENGNIEMMGTMGNNRSVVANNQQIVEGISQANNGVISAIEELGNYIVRELQKSRNQPVQVNLNPSSAWGNFNARSAEHYSHVTG